MMTKTNIINRTGLETLLSRGNKIVEIQGVDMDRAWGQIVIRGETVSHPDGVRTPAVHEPGEIVVWLPDCETGDEILDIMERDGICEVIVDQPVTQPNGRKNAFINSVLGGV